MNAARPSHFSAAGAGAYSRPATNPLNMRGDMAGAHTTPSGSQFQDTYMLDRSYVPMLGATINNISIEPALQQHQQVAHPQGAAQHFNFSPGSYATFTAQHNSGNLHNSGNGAPPHPAPVKVDSKGHTMLPGGISPTTLTILKKRATRAPRDVLRRRQWL
jgi:hypothetical protein